MLKLLAGEDRQDAIYWLKGLRQMALRLDGGCDLLNDEAWSVAKDEVSDYKPSTSASYALDNCIYRLIALLQEPSESPKVVRYIDGGTFRPGLVDLAEVQKFLDDRWESRSPIAEAAALVKTHYNSPLIECSDGRLYVVKVCPVAAPASQREAGKALSDRIDKVAGFLRSRGNPEERREMILELSRLQQMYDQLVPPAATPAAPQESDDREDDPTLKEQSWGNVPEEAKETANVES